MVKSSMVDGQAGWTVFLGKSLYPATHKMFAGSNEIEVFFQVWQAHMGDFQGHPQLHSTLSHSEEAGPWILL